MGADEYLISRNSHSMTPGVKHKACWPELIRQGAQIDRMDNFAKYEIAVFPIKQTTILTYFHFSGKASDLPVNIQFEISDFQQDSDVKDKSFLGGLRHIFITISYQGTPT